jgi:hypothetical protein
MPRIAKFYGIAIYMYFRDHAPPHFHAIYGRYDAEVEGETAEARRAGNGAKSTGASLKRTGAWRGLTGL